MSFLTKIEKNIQRHGLVDPSDHLLVGISGGADSVALLLSLYELAGQWGFKLSAAHVHHQLRKSADGDERFVRKLCGFLNVPCTILKIRVRENNQPGSLEDLARTKRFAALISLARRKKANKIALAHHQDDLAETVLMRILRGSGVQGLQGILPKKEIHRFTVIRPLLAVNRGEIEAFLRQKKQNFRSDPTNRHLNFLRNKVRLKLIPLLAKQYNPQIKQGLVHLADNMATDYDFLYQAAQDVYKKMISYSAARQTCRIDIRDFQKLHPSQRRLILRLCLMKLKGNLNRFTLTHMAEMEDLLANRPTGSSVHLPDGLEVSKTPTEIIILKKKDLLKKLNRL